MNRTLTTVIAIQIADQQNALALDGPRLEEAIRSILDEAAVAEAEISLAVVDDPTIQVLNRKYLGHDYPTDVLSFVLERSEDRLEGEVIVSADTAVASAGQYGWTPEEELLLYVIHGTLHLVGYADGMPTEQAEMRRREAACLARFGLEPHWQPDDSPAPGGNEIP
ncbi:MAG: rRNA maturation RNase YbeY [Pirellulales bacterium]|nr:rRNA maturation RNase YbeY [Pirellulales bacterium]